MDINRTKQRFEWKFKVECLLYFGSAIFIAAQPNFRFSLIPVSQETIFKYYIISKLIAKMNPVQVPAFHFCNHNSPWLTRRLPTFAIIHHSAASLPG
jgi:hypothetical protein